jgi:hypothetical protein
VASVDLGVVVPQVTSFGMDGVGRVYVMSLTGAVYRLDPAQSQRRARERSSAIQAAARSPSQIGVRRT